MTPLIAALIAVSCANLIGTVCSAEFGPLFKNPERAIVMIDLVVFFLAIVVAEVFR